VTIKYFLFIVFAGNMQVVGPFDGLVACEKAAGQAKIAVIEARRSQSNRIGTACLSTKHAEFKYKEPK
jgi:hypothetical protein